MSDMGKKARPQLRLNNDEVQTAMARLGITSNSALAAHTGVSTKTIERARSGEGLSGTTLAALSLHLGVPVYALASPVRVPQDAA